MREGGVGKRVNQAERNVTGAASIISRKEIPIRAGGKSLREKGLTAFKYEFI